MERVWGRGGGGVIQTNNVKLAVQAGIELSTNGTKVHFCSALFMRGFYICVISVCRSLLYFVFQEGAF